MAVSRALDASVPVASGTGERSQSLVYLVALTAALAGLLFGLDLGVIAGALPFIAKEFGATAGLKELVVSSLLAGAVPGTFVGGVISRRFGRRTAILAGAALFSLASILVAVSPSIGFLIGCRVVLGFAIGIATFAAPLYLSEMAPQQIRGRLVSTYVLMMTIGVLAAFLSDTALSPEGRWRTMLGVLAIPSALMFLGALLLPESPRWFMMTGQPERARAVLRRLRHADEVEPEIEGIEAALRTKQRGLELWRTTASFRRIVLLGMGLQLMQQFSGVNVVYYYAPRIFKDVGFSSTDAMWGMVVIGLINVFATFVSIGFVDKVGRKPLLIAGFVLMGVSIGIVGAMFQVGVEGSAPVQVAAIVGLAVFIAGFAMSVAPVIWVLCSEIYPLAGRDLGMALSTACNFLGNGIVAATFLTILNWIGDTPTFWMYGSLNLLFAWVVLRIVPETKNVSLETIERNLFAGKRLVEIGR